MSNSENQTDKTFFIDTDDVNEITIDDLKELIADIDNIYDSRIQLKDKVDLATKKKEAYSVVCTQTTTTALNTAISEANAILDNDNDLTTDDINDKTLALSKATASYLLSYGADILCFTNTNKYTVWSKEMLASKILSVYSAINNESITQTDLDANILSIQAGIDELKELDPSKLEPTANDIYYLKYCYVCGKIRLACTDYQDYTEESKTALLNALDSNEGLVKGTSHPDIYETAIDSGIDEISQAIHDLIYIEKPTDDIYDPGYVDPER